MNRVIRSALLACAALCFAPPVLAQYKIGVVNLDRLVREAPAAISAQKRLERDFSPREKELAALDERIRKGQDELAKNGVTMSPSARQKSERELIELNRDLQRRQQAFQEDLTQRRNEALRGLVDQANRAVRELAQTEKFDVIFQDAVYWSPAIDHTERVMKVMVDPATAK